MAIIKSLACVLMIGLSVVLAHHSDSTDHEGLQHESMVHNVSNEIEQFTEVKQNRQRLNCEVNFSWYKKFTTGFFWSTSVTNASTYLHLLDFTDYATSFEDFVEKYPTFTMDTEGAAYSKETFGDVGKGHFGKLTYPTNKFGMKLMEHFVFMVEAEMVKFAYSATASVGVFLIKEDNDLYLHPNIYSHLRSDWFKKRYVRIGLTIKGVTFNPK